MPSNNNRVVLAGAGSRKTQLIVDAIAAGSRRRILVTTYTVENLAEIARRLVRQFGAIPPNVTLAGWFTFLLRDGIRPYQNFIFETNQVRSINFDPGKPHKGTAKKQVGRFYLDAGSNVYRDNAADLAYHLNEQSKGLVVDRIELLYDEIYVDEVQDLSGWDLDFLDLLFDSTCAVTVVGDARQATYATTQSTKNSGYRGLNLPKWFAERQKKDRCSIEDRMQNYRCHPEICAFANDLYPDMPASESQMRDTSGHDGIFHISRDEALDYFAKYDPVVLRWDRRSDVLGLSAVNFGECKGESFDRVLIFPTVDMKKYLVGRGPAVTGQTLAKFYVAVTRARFSVAFVV